MHCNLKCLVIDLIPLPAHMAISTQEMVGTASLMLGDMLAVTLAGGATFPLRVNPRDALAAQHREAIMDIERLSTSARLRRLTSATCIHRARERERRLKADLSHSILKTECARVP